MIGKRHVGERVRYRWNLRLAHSLTESTRDMPLEKVWCFQKVVHSQIWVLWHKFGNLKSFITKCSICFIPEICSNNPLDLPPICELSKFACVLWCHYWFCFLSLLSCLFHLQSFDNFSRLGYLVKSLVYIRKSNGFSITFGSPLQISYYPLEH